VTQVLGASWAVYRAVIRRLGTDPASVPNAYRRIVGDVAG
jgi:hypothetical protein